MTVFATQTYISPTVTVAAAAAAGADASGSASSGTYEGGHNVLPPHTPFSFIVVVMETPYRERT
jgi:hypothetical protein